MNSCPSPTRDTRLSRRSGSPPDEQDTLLAQVGVYGNIPAPSLPLSQLQELVSLIVGRIPSPVQTLGRKRARKSGSSQAPQAKKMQSMARKPSTPTDPGPSNSIAGKNGLSCDVISVRCCYSGFRVATKNHASSSLATGSDISAFF